MVRKQLKAKKAGSLRARKRGNLSGIQLHRLLEVPAAALRPFLDITDRGRLAATSTSSRLQDVKARSGELTACRKELEALTQEFMSEGEKLSRYYGLESGNARSWARLLARTKYDGEPNLPDWDAILSGEVTGHVPYEHSWAAVLNGDVVLGRLSQK
jgi:hypothetical protein